MSAVNSRNETDISVPILQEVEGNLKVTKGTRPEDLTGWKKVMYEVALLAPKLILSGAGWAIGATFGLVLGAGVGDMVGTFVGCTISLGIELLLRKYVLHDPTLNEDGAIWRITKSRLKSAVILSAGSLAGGMVFSSALKWTAPLVIGKVHIIQAIATGVITAGFFGAGMTAARTTYTVVHKIATSVFKMEKDPDYEDLKLSWKNFKVDVKLSALLIAPAEAAFVATSVPILGMTAFLGAKFAALKAAATVLIGGTAAKVAWGTVSELTRKDVELEDLPSRRNITDETEHEKVA